jgi:hypothetical protein
LNKSKVNAATKIQKAFRKKKIQNQTIFNVNNYLNGLLKGLNIS